MDQVTLLINLVPGLFSFYGLRRAVQIFKKVKQADEVVFWFLIFNLAQMISCNVAIMGYLDWFFAGFPWYRLVEVQGFCQEVSVCMLSVLQGFDSLCVCKVYETHLQSFDKDWMNCHQRNYSVAFSSNYQRPCLMDQILLWFLLQLFGWFQL